jgi:hypothetical protein
MSAYSQLQGFFPPGAGPLLSAEQTLHEFPPIESNFEAELNFLGNNALKAKSKVFAIKVLNKGDHDFSLHDPSVCEEIKQKIAYSRDSDKIREFIKFFNANYAQKIYKVINQTEQIFSLSNYNNLQNLFDAFICGYTDGRNYQKDLAAQNLSVIEFYRVTKEFMHLDLFDVFISDEYTALMLISPFLAKLLNYMDTRIQKDVNNITFYSKMILKFRCFPTPY